MDFKYDYVKNNTDFNITNTYEEVVSQMNSSFPNLTELNDKYVSIIAELVDPNKEKDKDKEKDNEKGKEKEKEKEKKPRLVIESD